MRKRKTWYVQQVYFLGYDLIQLNLVKKGKCVDDILLIKYQDANQAEG